MATETPGNEREILIGAHGEVEEVEADRVAERARQLGDSGEVVEEGNVTDTEPAVRSGPEPDEAAERIAAARKARANIAKRLDELARTLDDEPLFIAERDAHAQAFDLPGNRGWILPRTLSPEEERRYDEIVGGKPRVHMRGDEIDAIETSVNRRERWAFLVEHAIEECCLRHTNGHEEHLRRKNPGQMREMRRLLLHEISPRFAEYIELRLLDYNGLTPEQRGVRDFT